MIFLPTLGVAFACLVLWTIVHFFRAADTIPMRWNNDVAKNVINTTDVDNIEIYHERYLFRDLMMVLCHVITIGYAGAILGNPCSSACKTPFSMFATAVLVLNIVRLLFLFIRAYFDYHRLRELCCEVRAFISWRNEKRLREDAIPSIVPRWRYNIYTIFEGFCFCAVLVFLALATIWVENGECLATCSKGYYLTNHLVVALFMIESIYLLSSIALVFFRRTSGLEAVEDAIAVLHQETVRKAQIKKDRMAIINATDPY